MKVNVVRVVVIIAVLALGCWGQSVLHPPRVETTVRPMGPSELAGIRVANREKNLKDVAALIEIAQAMKIRIEKESPWVVSVKTAKETDEIQKLSRQIRERLKSE